MSERRSYLPLSEAKSPFFVGIDVGGTNTKFGVVDDLGRTIAWKSIPSEVENGPEDATARMGQAVGEVVREAGLETSAIARVGLGSAGPMDLEAGTLVDPPNLPGWNHFPLRDRVSHHCGLPVTFANDGNAAAYGEFWVGSGRDFDSMALLTLGTGIGCGIIVNDFVIEGEHSHGGEFGHAVIDCSKNPRICGCGRPGHLEAYASATALIKRTEESLSNGQTSSLSSRLADGEELTPKLVGEEAERSDEFSLRIVLETARYLGIGIATLIHTIDPDGVLLGGAMTFGGSENELGRRFLETIRQEARCRLFAVLAESTIIDFASLGGDAGYIGAAGCARVDHRKKA